MKVPQPIPHNTSQSRTAGDVRSTVAYSHYLIMKAQLAGNFRFDGHTPSDEEREIAVQCRQLCDSIAHRLPVCKEKDIPDYLECYDILYRVGNRTTPDTGVIDRHRARLFNSWKAGNRDIEESSLFGIIAPAVKSRPDKAGIEQVKAYLSILDRWVVTLNRHHRFPDVSSCENYQRITLIMRENLDRYLGADSSEIKRRIYDRNRVDDLSTLPTVILRAYRHFIGSLPPGVIDFDDKMQLDNQILLQLADRRDLHPYDRAAYRLALTTQTITMPTITKIHASNEAI